MSVAGSPVGLLICHG